MNDIVLNTIFKYRMLDYGDHVIVGVSGGLDSMCLLSVICNLRQKFSLGVTVVHVNHGIRGDDAYADQCFVVQSCKSLGVHVEVYSYDIIAISRDLKISEEEAGRRMRYEAFYDALVRFNGNKIAVAHNMNDNAETFLFNLLRGTGLNGLGGIPPVRDKIIRPLLFCSRSQIEKYCCDFNIAHVVDATNSLDKYTRNKIRLHLLPWIEREINSGVVRSINKTSELLREDQMFIDSIVDVAYLRCLIRADVSETVLDIYLLKDYDAVIQKRVVRRAIGNIKPDIKDINFVNVMDVLMLLDKQTGKSVNLSGGIVVKRNYDNLIFFIQNSVVINQSFCYHLSLGEKTFIPELNMYFVLHLSDAPIDFKFSDNCTILFDYDKICNGVKIRTRKTGDKIYLKGVGNKKISALFIDSKIPQNERDCIPILADGENVMCIVGVRLSDKYKVDDSTSKFLILEYWEGLNYEGNN